MADYIFTQNGDNNVQIGDVTGMPYHVETALKWALEHNFQSVAAQYARTLALEVERLRDENERLYAALKLAQARARDYDADIEAGRLIRLPFGAEDPVYFIGTCEDVMKTVDNDWSTGTGAVECPFEDVCHRDDCDGPERTIFETGMAGYARDWDDGKPVFFLSQLNGVYSDADIGKTIFSTREAARAALEGGQRHV